VLQFLELPEGPLKYVTDSALLVALSVPLLYALLVRDKPLFHHNAEREYLVSGVPTLEELERQAIIRALESAHGDCSHAAKVLGIGRATVYRKLRKYDIHTAARYPHRA